MRYQKRKTFRASLPAQLLWNDLRRSPFPNASLVGRENILWFLQSDERLTRMKTPLRDTCALAAEVHVSPGCTETKRPPLWSTAVSYGCHPAVQSHLLLWYILVGFSHATGLLLTTVSMPSCICCRTYHCGSSLLQNVQRTLQALVRSLHVTQRVTPSPNPRPPVDSGAQPKCQARKAA